MVDWMITNTLSQAWEILAAGKKSRAKNWSLMKAHLVRNLDGFNNMKLGSI
jgi:hypothetical protein